MTRTTMKNILPLRCWLLFPLVSAVHVWDYGEEVPPSTPSGFGRRVERSTFSDIFETLGRGKSIDFALQRALSVKPKSKVGKKSVRFPDPSPFTTPRPSVKGSPTPQSFSEIFQPRPPLVLKEHSSEQLKQLTTTERIDDTKNVPLTTLKAILDHVSKKEIVEKSESQYDYEYVYDYVEVDDVANIGSRFSSPIESNEVENKFPPRPPTSTKKTRPKIVPRQRVVPPKLSENKKPGFVRFVTPQPTNLGSAVTQYNEADDTLEILNPPIVIYTDESEDLSTRRVGYTYKQPDTKTDPTNLGTVYREETPEEPLTPSLQSVYETPITQSTFTDLLEGGGATYKEQTPEEPLTPSLQSAYDPPTTSSPEGRVKFGYKYSGQAGPQINYRGNQGNNQPPPPARPTYSAPTSNLQPPAPPPPSYTAPAPREQPPPSYTAPAPREQPPPSYSAPAPREQPPPSYSAPAPREQPPPSYSAPAPREQPPPSYSAPAPREQPPPSYSAPAPREQPPPSYSAPAPREQPLPSSYDGPTERPPQTTTRRTTTTIVMEQPPPAYSAPSPVTYAPTFLNEELPPYEPDNDLYGDDLPGYRPSVFVTPTPPPIVIPPKTMPGRRLKPSFGPRRSEKQKIAFSSTLLPPIQPLRITTTPPPAKQGISSFSDIFSKGEKKSEEQKTSFKNNAPAPHYVGQSEEYEYEEDSYGQPLAQPISNSQEVSEPSDDNFPEYIDYNDVTISGLDPRFSSDQTAPGDLSFDILQKLRKKESSHNRFETHDNGDFIGQNNFDETTRLKGILKQDSGPFGRFVEKSPPPSDQFSGGYSAPVPDPNTPTAFSEILDPPETTTPGYVAPLDVDDYQSPPRRPDSGYTVSVEPTIIDNAGVNNGHSGSLKIDLNININKESERPSSNSHGPVQTTFRPSNLPTTERYVIPTTGHTNTKPQPTVFSDILQPADDEYIAPLQDITESYDPPTERPKKTRPSTNYPRNYGSKITDDDERPNDIVAPDYNIDLYKDDLTAPDVDTGYDVPSAPVVSDYYNAPVVEDYTGPASYDSYDYEENYFGHEAPGYEEFVEYDYHTKPPRGKHKKIKPFVNFGSHSPHRKPKHQFKHQKSKHKHHPPVYEENYFGEDFYEAEPHLEKPKHKEEIFYEPIEKPHHQDDSFYEPLEKPIYDSYYDEPLDDYHLNEPHYQDDTFYEPLDKPVHQPDNFYEPLEKPVYHSDTFYEPLEKPLHHSESYYEEPYDDNLYLDPVPKGYYDKTTELIPELRDVIRPLDWNVHDFSSWRRILDETRFGGTLKSNGGYGREVSHYNPPEISNEIEDSYDEPLYYEDYYHDYEDHDSYADYEDHESSSPYSPNLYDYDTYQPSYYNPQPAPVVPEPFDIPFDDWLDSSGVGAFGLPSVKHSTYASPPAWDHGYQDHWVPSERSPSYGSNYLVPGRVGQVEVPVVRDLYTPAPRTHYRRITPGQLTESSSPGSIWTGLASFADSLGEKNHYRGHSVGMVSMGSSDSDGMMVMGSQDFAVMVRPPTDFNMTTVAGSESDTSDIIKTTAGGKTGPDFSIPSSMSPGETTNNTHLPSQSSSEALPSIPADFEQYILHSSVIGSTLSKMSKMLKTYLK